MATHVPQHPPTPERFFNAINAYEQSEALKAAIELGIFTAIAEGNTSAAAIAQRCNASDRGTRILCDFLTVHGFLAKTDSQYSLAPDAAFFLNQHSPAYVGGAIEFLLTPRIREGHSRLTDAVRNGACALAEGTTGHDDDIWVKFAQAMMPLTHMPSQLIAAELRKGGESTKVLDIASSHGLYGIAVAKQNPATHIYANDWKNVLEVGAKNAEAMGVADRYHPIPGSAFEVDLGTGYDLALITNFLHHFDLPTCTTFMRRIYEALEPGGRAAILEFVPNPDRVSPPTAAAFSMMMLASTPSGDAYTFAELEQCCKEAGFTRAELVPEPMGVGRLVIAYR